jgi:prolyl-tRNA synthetase
MYFEADASAAQPSTAVAAMRKASRGLRMGKREASHTVPPVTRLSRYLLPTEKEAPADAEAVSHKLLVRAGMVRQVGSGFWTFMPAGWRTHRKVEQIIREELDAVGCEEMLMPVLQPADLWRQSGRYDIDELFKLKDRREADLVLAMTHEECITFHM